MKPATWIARLVLLVLAVVAVPQAASAQPRKPTAADDARGRVHFQAGQKLSASGDYAGAYREFAAGYEATGRPLFLFNMAEAARASGDVDKARDGYRAFLQADPKSALAATAKTRLADLDLEQSKPVEYPLAPPASASPEPPPLVPLHPPSTTQSVPAGDTLPASRFTTQPAEQVERPIWKGWPFWAVVTGAVVAGGAITYAATRDRGPACGAGCSQIDFR